MQIVASIGVRTAGAAGFDTLQLRKHGGAPKLKNRPVLVVGGVETPRFVWCTGTGVLMYCISAYSSAANEGLCRVSPAPAVRHFCFQRTGDY